MTGEPSDPPPAEGIVQAVREILADEIDRVSHPGPRPDDHDGWHAIGDPDPTSPGHPRFDPKTWQYFQLRDVAVIDGLIAIAFTWTEPRTPPLTYLLLTHPRPGSIHAAATSARSHLRALLAPGWRERVERQWLDHDRVLISRGRRRRSSYIEDAIDADLQRRWTGSSEIN